MRVIERGQVLLIVILVMTVALTIGLSVASRTITNLRLTAEEESSQRAFSAAEAGIEQALQSNTASSGTLSNNATYKTEIDALSGAEFVLNNGSQVLKDDAVDIWLSTYPDYSPPWTGTLTLYWGLASDKCDPVEANNSMAALEVVLIHGIKASPIATQYALDPCSARASGPTGNQFKVVPSGGTTIGNQTFNFKETISVNSGLLMRVIPLYSATNIGVKVCDGCKALPTQGKLITSVGISDQAERKIIGFQENPKLPIQFFPFILFSPK